MKRALAFVILLMLVTISAFAQTSAVPALMNFQGRLAKPDGTPVPDATYSVLFSLYSAVTGGTLKWSETDSVTSHNGAFAVLLGKTVPLTDSLFAGNLWLEIKIGVNNPLTPRQQIVSVGNAFKSDTIKDGGVTLSSLASGVLTFSNISGTLGSGQFTAGSVPLTALDPNSQAVLGLLATTAAPALVSSTAVNSGPDAVVVSGNYAYVTEQFGNLLLIYDVTNPAAPVLKSSVVTRKHARFRCRQRNPRLCRQLLRQHPANLRCDEPRRACSQKHNQHGRLP